MTAAIANTDRLSLIIADGGRLARQIIPSEQPWRMPASVFSAFVDIARFNAGSLFFQWRSSILIQKMAAVKMHIEFGFD